ncbi:hypothetical protein Ciccas_006815 [Cichlidogyrus casuarinus]|uniref:CP-type G domain-containing protein n=1 Tax=Cichlidogyrus casuarinus TaxID=1844966 RepID=A0ABD2Q599_9PLAT
MVKACRKVKSKRMTLRKKYKIIKKVKEHNRKLRKEKKANPRKFRRKDPGIPNSMPFKEEMVKHIAETKEKFAEIRKNQFLAAINAKNNPKPVENEFKINKRVDVSHIKEFLKVVKEADVVLEVVDARDPIGTRCIQTEETVIAAKKKLVIILNKIDLVPKENVKKWLNYFREFYPTLPFKANTQNQAENLGQTRKAWIREFISDGKNHKTALGIGVNGLMALLGNYARGMAPAATKTEDKSDSQLGRLVVGIVGLPNTGKSAIVNTLKRRKVTVSSNVPGQTKQAELHPLDKHIFLYDTPGIVVNKLSDPCEMVLKNCQRPETLEDPRPAVEAILRRVPKRQLIVRYGIADYASVSDFLVQLATRQGKLRKGGVPHTRAASLRLIHDWITGKITYHTQPPENDLEKQQAMSAFQPSQLFQNSLDLEQLVKFDDEALDAVPSRDMADTAYSEDAVLKTGEPIRISTLKAGDLVEMDEDDESFESDEEDDGEEETGSEEEDEEDDEEMETES